MVRRYIAELLILFLEYRTSWSSQPVYAAGNHRSASHAMPIVVTHAAEEKGKRKAEDAEPEGPKQPEAPPTPEEELEAEARRAARDRLGGWMRLRLEALLLLETVLAEAEAHAAGGGAQQQSLAAVQEDLRQVLLTAACETPTGSANCIIVSGISR